jgi:hypothetical protein
MKRVLKSVSIGVFAFGALYVLSTEHLRAKARESADKNQKIGQAIVAQRSWNEQNIKRIQIKSRMVSILSNFGESLHYDPTLMAELILAKCEQRRLDPFLVLGIIKIESDFNSLAVSNKGAMGLMQIQPTTANHLAPYGDFSSEKSGRLILDNELNISLGTLYLAKLIRRFGTIELALEAYNRGPDALKRDISDGDYYEPNYSDKVIRHYRNYKFGGLDRKKLTPAIDS